MTPSTQLKPLSDERVRQILEMLQQLRADTSTALALDDHGRVLGVVGEDDPQAQHLLGDLDVHA
jgi:hypothetical protein